MKRYLFLFVFLAFTANVFSQEQRVDLIITKAGDEFKVMIDKVDEESVYFIRLDDTEKEVLEIQKKNVKEIIYGYTMGPEATGIEEFKKQATKEKTDLLVRTNGEKMFVHLLDITDESIYYYLPGDSEMESQGINRSLIQDIYKLEDGIPEKYVEKSLYDLDKFKRNTEEMESSDKEGQLDEEEMRKIVYVDNKTYNVKINFSAMTVGSTILTFEKAIDKNRSWEVSAAVHGFGLLTNIEDKEGLGAEAGYKVKLGNIFSDYYLPDHILSGTYIKYVAGFGSVSEQTRSFSVNRFLLETKNRNYGYIGVDLGYQWIFGNRVSMDMYTGMHYYNGDFEVIVNDDGEINTFTNRTDFEDGDIFADNNLSIKAGFRIGYIFGKGKLKNKNQKR